MKNLEARRRIRRHQKQRAGGQIQALHDELHERFPHAFLRQPDKVAPLKKGIYHDIKEALADRTYSTRIIGWTLRRYTQRHAYLRALAERKPRIDLSGQPVDTVTEEEQQQAMAQLNAMRRRRGKSPQATRATEQAEDKPLTSEPSGQANTKAKHHSRLHGMLTANRRHKPSGEVSQAQGEA